MGLYIFPHGNNHLNAILSRHYRCPSCRIEREPQAVPIVSPYLPRKKGTGCTAGMAEGTGFQEISGYQNRILQPS